MRRPFLVFLAAAATAALLLVACGGGADGGPDDGAGVAHYVGSDACASCHPGASEAWAESHHAAAMRPATPEHVRGDFDDATLAHRGDPDSADALAVARFHRDGDRYLVTAIDASGEAREQEVLWTFGERPLQQYLVAGEGGRMQVLPFCWDTRPLEAGGQRWFRLNPADWMPPGDLLHWDGPRGEWNWMCADCHATDLQRGWDLEAEAYATRWSEATVGCEACHGPGSAHLAWADAAAAPDSVAEGAPEMEGDLGLTVRLGDADGGAWQWDEASARPVRNPPRAEQPELQVCASCHARRTPLVDGIEPGAPFLDQFTPALLEPGLYRPDGQILDEVYVWGSFQQSRMHQAGVTCNDCHEPHGGGMRAPGDALCTRCHDAPRYDAPLHEGHAAGTPGSACVDCHMPTRTYMEIDARRDHAFRVPRPDLAVAADSPSACVTCHADRDEAWAAEAVASWRVAAGRPADVTSAREQPFGPAFHAADRGDPRAAEALAELVADVDLPEMVRASALLRLAALGSARLPGAVASAVLDETPLVRLAAARAAGSLRPGDAFVLIESLLRDPLRAVRVEAVRTVLPLFADLQAGGEDERLLDALLAESEAALALRGGRPDGRFEQGVRAAQLGRDEEAENHYREALALDPLLVPAAINLADLLRATGRDEACRELLERSLAASPTPLPAAAQADLHHALGLALVRAGEEGEALEALAAAAAVPEAPARYAYVHGVALLTAGRTGDALTAFERGLDRWPWSTELLQGAADAASAAGLPEIAAGYRDRLGRVTRLLGGG